MISLKRKIIFLLLIVCGVSFLLIFPAYLEGNSSLNQNEFSRKDISDSVNYSESFFELKKIILNTKADRISILDSIIQLKSKFESDFLTALLHYRQEEYTKSFEILTGHLKNYPLLPEYYEMTALTGRITTQLHDLNNKLNKQSDTLNSRFFFLKGIIDFHQQNYKSAASYFSKSKNIDEGFTESHLWLANTLRMLGDYTESLNILQKIEKDSLENSELLPKIKNSIGTVYFLSGDYETAGKYYSESKKLLTGSGNSLLEIRTTANLALIKDIYGNIDEARKDYISLITKTENIGDKELLAFLYSELGVSYSFTGNLIEAKKYYHKSYQLYKSLNHNERLSYLSSNIASVFLQQANYKSALKYYQEGLNYSGENVLGQIFNLMGSADVFANNSNYTKALEYYTKAKTLADSTKNISALNKINQGLGALYFNVNRPLKALTILKEAEKTVEPDASPFEAAGIYHKIGMVYIAIDSLESAKKYFLTGIGISEKSGDTYYDLLLNTGLAKVYKDQEQLEEAENLLKEKIPQTIANGFNNLAGQQKMYLGETYKAQKKYKEAIKNLKEAFEILETTKDFNNQCEAGYLLAKVYIEQKDSLLAEEWLLKTINIVEKISPALIRSNEIQISHFEGVAQIYNELIKLYILQDRIEESFDLLEKYRSRNSLQNLFNIKLASKLSGEEKLNEIIDIRWMIESGLYTKVETDSLKKIFNVLTSGNNDISTEQMFINSSHKVEIIKIKESLKSDEHIISHFVSEDFINIYHLTNHSLNSERINLSRDSLLNLLKSVSPVYKSQQPDEEIFLSEGLFAFNAYASSELYDRVFRNIIERIPAEDKIIFCFPAELLHFPAEMLVTGWKEDMSSYLYNDKSFLISRNPVSYTPSASIYILQSKSNPVTGSQNLLIGDPEINNKEFSMNFRSALLGNGDNLNPEIQLFPLEYSAEEINEINNTISNNKVLLSKDASEKEFKINAPGSKIIHLSTHSFLIKNQPVIILSQNNDPENDGFVELSEIVQLDLNSELVVLSSCRSGLGQIEEAEGIIGMQKAFFEAGSSSIIVSLWDVNDKYTSLFMKDLYKQFKAGLNKSEALRQTKINFIKNHSANPYYWSGFVLSGNLNEMNFTEESSFNRYIFLFVTFISLYAILNYFLRKRSK